MILTLERREDALLIRLDPHDHVCSGAHDIVVSVLPVVGALDPTVHVALSWGHSVLLSIGGSKEFRDALELLSIGGSKEFRDALDAAIDVADALANASSLEEATRMAEDFERMLIQMGGIRPTG